jgi:hypothetical protein
MAIGNGDQPGSTLIPFAGQIGLSSDAITNGTIALSNIDYIRGAFKVYESESILQSASPNLFQDYQIVYCQDTNKLYQMEYIPAQFGGGPPIPASKTSASFQFPGAGSTDTGSLLITASVAGNTLTFEKGDGSTFDVALPGGSGGGIFAQTGSYYATTNDLQISGSLTVTGSSPSINIGTPEGSDNVYSDGFFSTFNENTRLANALDQISEAFADLAPAKAVALTGQQLVVANPSTLYSGYLAGGLIASDWYVDYTANQLVSNGLSTIAAVSLSSPTNSFPAGKKSNFDPSNVLEGGVTASITAQGDAASLSIKALNTGTGTVGALTINTLITFNNLWVKGAATIAHTMADTGSYKYQLLADQEAGQSVEKQYFYLGTYANPSVTTGTITSGSVTYNDLSGVKYLKTATFNIPSTGSDLFNPVYNLNQFSFSSAYTFDNNITTGSKVSDTPQFGDILELEVNPTLSAGLSSGQNAPTGTVAVTKPGKTGTYNASYTLTPEKVNSYVSDPATATNEPFLGESKRYTNLNTPTWVSSNPLNNGALQVQNGRLVGANAAGGGDYSGFASQQNYFRLFESGLGNGKSNGNFTLSATGFTQLQNWDSGNAGLEAAIVIVEEVTGGFTASKIFDLSRAAVVGPVVSNIYGAKIGTLKALSGDWTFLSNATTGASGNVILWIRYSSPDLTNNFLTNMQLTITS